MKIKTYKELREICKMFPKKKAELIILISKGGLGKSTLIKNIMGKNEYMLINSHSTPLQTYTELYNRKDKHIYAIFDDINELLKSSIQISILKSFCDLEEEKEIHYHSTSPNLKNIEQSFKLKGNAFIILNHLNSNNLEIRPLLDRGFKIIFEPSNEEIYKEMVRIGNKDGRKEIIGILDFLGINKDYAKNFSLRTFIKSCQLYSFNKKKWKDYILRDMEVSEENKKINDILNSNLKKSEKIKRLSKVSNKGIRTWQRYFKKMK